MKKRGTILVENVVFIVLNILFIAILILFIARQGSGAIVLEQSYAKQIALLIDSAQPGMIIKLDMEKGKNLAEENGINFEDAVRINGNTVIVKLSDQGGYSYSFFNNVNVGDPYTDETNYIFAINKQNNREVEG